MKQPERVSCLVTSKSGSPFVAEAIDVRIVITDVVLFAFVSRIDAHPMSYSPYVIPGPHPSRGGWSVAERDSWNLAARMHRHEDQVLRLLDDTRVPFTNNAAERPLRPVKLHDCDDAVAVARVA
ncbi:MAG: IS66 family transposase [Acidimicrobiia bacterium]